MSRAALSGASVGRILPSLRQKPWSNAVDAGRGPGLRRGGGLRQLRDAQHFRADFPGLWSDFIRATCATRHDAVVCYGVTFQTACNWWDGRVCIPMGNHVGLAGRLHPAVYARIILRIGGR